MSFGSLAEFRAACRGAGTVTAALARVPHRRVIVEKSHAGLDRTFWFGQAHARQSVARPSRVRQPYKEHAGVQMTVSSRMRTFAQAPFTIGTKLPDGRLAAVGEGVDPIADQLIKLFDCPNRFMTGRRMWMHTRSWLDLIGECFWILGRERVSEAPRWIQPWPGGSLWRPGPPGPDGYPVGWLFRHPITGRQVKISSDRLVFFRTVNPQTPVRGCAPLLATFTRLTADVEADDRDLAFFENNAEASGYLTYPHAMDEERWEEIQTRYEDRHMGARKQFRIGVLDDGTKFVSNTVTNRDMEYLKMRQFNQMQVQGTFNWSDVFLGRGDGLPFANFIAQLRSGWENNIIPQQEIDADEVWVQLFRFISGGKYRGFFDHSKVAALRQAREQQWATVNEMKKAGNSLKEAVRQLGIENKPQPGWEEVLVPATLLPIQAVLAGDTGPSAPAPANPEGAETSTPPTSDTAQPENADDERPETQSDGGPQGNAIDSDMAKLLDAVDHHQVRCEQKVLAQIAAMTDVQRQSTARKRRQQWLAWNQSVLRTSERHMIRRLRPYFTALGETQMRQFDRVARQNRDASDVPGYTTRALGLEDIDDILFDREEWDARLRTLMRQSMNLSLDLSLAFTTQQLTELVGPQVIGVDLNSAPVQRFLDTRVQLTTGINARIERELSRQLQAGFANGESTRELRTRIASITDRLNTPARTLRIARTEQGTMASTLRFQLGQAAVDFHIWIHAADELVRNSHFVAELTSADSPVRVGEPFSNGLLHPLDPLGAAEEVINCRCLAELLARSLTQNLAMTAEEMRTAFFAGMESIVASWETVDAEAWGERLLQLDATDVRSLIPFSCNGRH